MRKFMMCFAMGFYVFIGGKILITFLSGNDIAHSILYLCAVISSLAVYLKYEEKA